MKFEAGIKPSGLSTATKAISWSELSGTIIHIICSIIQFMTDVWPGLQLH
jgi:hypothetical protein